MKYYIISDTHFNHDEIIEYCNRPVDHENKMLSALRAINHSGNILIHLGDLALGNEKIACEKINQEFHQRKILILGNHDSKSASWYMEHGWSFVCESFKLKYCGKVICFSHKPQSWDGDWEINVHGHLHNLGHRDNEYKDLKQWHRLYSPELMDYKPIELSTFIQKK